MVWPLYLIFKLIHSSFLRLWGGRGGGGGGGVKRRIIIPGQIFIFLRSTVFALLLL